MDTATTISTKSSTRWERGKCHIRQLCICPALEFSIVYISSRRYRGKVEAYGESIMEGKVNKLGVVHPVVIIFGAGATRGGLEGTSSIPPPVDKDFFNISNKIVGHGTGILANRVLSDVFAIYGRANDIGLEKYYRDIETRERIGKFAKSGNKPKDWGKRREDLEELIRRVYIHTTCAGKHFTPNTSKIHREILRQLKAGDTILTFNYDLVIEESFPEHIWNPKDGYGYRTYNFTKGRSKQWIGTNKVKKAKSQVLLLKLHGSINWDYQLSGAIRIKERPYTVRGNYVAKISIVAPGWNKPIDKNPYSELWRKARLRLENCKTLIIVGYSLPETDLLAQALFAEVVRKRKSRWKRLNALSQLHLAGGHESVQERFVSLFTPAMGPVGQVFKYKDIEEFYKRLMPEEKTFNSNKVGGRSEKSLARAAKNEAGSENNLGRPLRGE